VYLLVEWMDLKLLYSCFIPDFNEGI